MRVVATISRPDKSIPKIPSKTTYVDVTKVVYSSTNIMNDLVHGIFIHFKDGVLMLDNKIVLDLTVEDS